MPLSRRSLLGSSCLTGAALVVGHGAAAGPAFAQGDQKLMPTSFGPASLTAAIRGAAVVGDSVFVTSRFNTPEGKMRLGEFDVNTGEMRSIDDLTIPSNGGQKLAA